MNLPEADEKKPAETEPTSHEEVKEETEMRMHADGEGGAIMARGSILLQYVMISALPRTRVSPYYALYCGASLILESLG